MDKPNQPSGTPAPNRCYRNTRFVAAMCCLLGLLTSNPTANAQDRYLDVVRTTLDENTAYQAGESVGFDLVTLDTFGTVGTSGTIPEPGLYRITADILWASTSGSTFGELRINGVQAVNMFTNTPTWDSTTASTYAELQAGDTVEVVLASGSAFVGGRGFSNLSIAKINEIPPAVGCNPADLAAPFGLLNASDVNAFVNAFLVSESAADLASPIGVFTASDINIFVNSFVAGCP